MTRNSIANFRSYAANARLLVATLILPLLGTAPLHAAEVGKMEGENLQMMEQRFEARSFKTFGFGPATMLGDAEGGIAYQFSVGHLWEVHPHAGIVVRGDLVADFENMDFLSTAGLGMRYFLLASEISPFLQADFGMGTDYSDALGFQVGGSVGLVFFRTSSVHFVIEPNVQWVIAKDNPMAAGVKIGVAY